MKRLLKATAAVAVLFLAACGSEPDVDAFEEAVVNKKEEVIAQTRTALGDAFSEQIRKKLDQEMDGVTFADVENVVEISEGTYRGDVIMEKDGDRRSTPMEIRKIDDKWTLIE